MTTYKLYIGPDPTPKIMRQWDLEDEIDREDLLCWQLVANETNTVTTAFAEDEKKIMEGVQYIIDTFQLPIDIEELEVVRVEGFL